MDAKREIQDLIERFPLPAVLLGSDSTIVLENALGLERVSQHWLASHARELGELARGAQSRVFEVPGATQESLRATVHATPVRGGTVVVFDGAHAAASEDTQRLQQRIAELELQSTTDRLTSLGNRRHFDEVALREIAFSDQHGMPLSLVVFDLDHFKLVNDQHGHAVGDRLLKVVAQRLRSSCRPTDQLFRWGGEEFALLAPATGRDAALRLAQRLRAAIAATPFGSVGHQTISAGLAERRPRESAEHWFARVDAALYRAKNAGRDRVIGADLEDPARTAAQRPPSALKLVWNAHYCSGNQLIDDEHRGLFDGANDLIAAMSDSSIDEPAIRQAIDRLLVAIARHFTDEEAVLGRVGYPELERHRRVHADLLREARTLRDAIRDGSSSAGEVIEFVAYEIINRHILKADRAYFPFVADLH